MGYESPLGATQMKLFRVGEFGNLKCIRVSGDNTSRQTFRVTDGNFLQNTDMILAQGEGGRVVPQKPWKRLPAMEKLLMEQD